MTSNISISKSGIDGFDIDISIGTHCDTIDDITKIIEMVSGIDTDKIPDLSRCK